MISSLFSIELFLDLAVLQLLMFFVLLEAFAVFIGEWIDILPLTKEGVIEP